MNLRSPSKSVSALRLLGVALICPSAIALLSAGPAVARPVAQAPVGPTIRANAFGLRFEANQGQFEEQVRYLARGKGYGLYLTDEGATLALEPQGAPRSVVSLRVAGARSVQPQGVGRLPGLGNYAVGERQHWVAGVQSFGAVKYAGVLPGIDLVYHSDGKHELEYDFLLAPGADPQGIELYFDGVSSLSVGDQGDASLQLEDGSALRQPRPVAYQLDDAGVRHFVAAAFRQISAARLGFRVTGYDPSRALIIDPVLTYSTLFGSGAHDEFAAVAVGSDGSTYAVGYTVTNLFPTKPVAPYKGGFSDAVIVKLNAAGTDYVYSTFFGGTSYDQAYGVAVDPPGNAYVTGVTDNGALGQDCFVVKLNNSGGVLYSALLGGSGDDSGQGIAVSSAGEAYVTGSTFSTSTTGTPVPTPFPTTAGSFQPLPMPNNGNDAFVAKLNANGTLAYSTFLGGISGDSGQAITLDSSGGAIVVGQTASRTTFPLLAPAQASFGGSFDAFVTRLNPSGSALVYSTYLGGAAVDSATGVAQLNGAAIVVGATSSDDFPTVGASQGARGGNSDAFLARVHSTGGSFDYSTFLGGSGADQANAVAVDGAGFAYVVGQTASADFPKQLPLPGMESLSGASDAFLAGFSGGDRQFASFLGGAGDDFATGIARSGNNLLHVVGTTFSDNFPTVSPLVGLQHGLGDGFVARFSGLTIAPAPAGPPLLWLYAAGLLLGAGLLALSFRAPLRLTPSAGR